MARCEQCLSEKVCRYNDGINLYCKEDYECPHFKNKADFVELPCRCEKCKYRTTHTCAITGIETLFCDYGEKPVVVKPTHYCGYGERKST